MVAFQPLRETCFWERRNIKVQLGRQLIDGRADPLEVFRRPYVVDVLRKTIRRPLLLAIQRCEIEFVDWVAIVFGVLSIYDWVAIINSYRAVVMRDGKGQKLAVDFALTLHQAEELNDGPRGERHAVGVLTVRDVECCGAAVQ